MRNEVKLQISNGEIYADSIHLAGHFRKRHDHVLRDIDSVVSLPKSGERDDQNQELIETFFALNFFETEIIDSRGKRQRAYKLTRDGFDLIAMGFTGPRATLWKIKYIYAFRKAELDLQRQGEKARTLQQFEMFPDMVAEPEYTIAEVLEKLSTLGLFTSRTSANSLKTQIRRGDLNGRFDGRRWLMPASAVKQMITRRELHH